MLNFLTILSILFFSVPSFSRKTRIIESQNQMINADGWVSCNHKFNPQLDAIVAPTSEGCILLQITVPKKCQDRWFSFLCNKERNEKMLSYKDFLLLLKPNTEFVGIQTSDYYGTTKIFYKKKDDQ